MPENEIPPVIRGDIYFEDTFHYAPSAVGKTYLLILELKSCIIDTEKEKGGNTKKKGNSTERRKNEEFY